MFSPADTKATTRPRRRHVGTVASLNMCPTRYCSYLRVLRWLRQPRSLFQHDRRAKKSNASHKALCPLADRTRFICRWFLRTLAIKLYEKTSGWHGEHIPFSSAFRNLRANHAMVERFPSSDKKMPFQSSVPFKYCSWARTMECTLKQSISISCNASFLFMENKLVLKDPEHNARSLILPAFFFLSDYCLWWWWKLRHHLLFLFLDAPTGDALCKMLAWKNTKYSERIMSRMLSGIRPNLGNIRQLFSWGLEKISKQSFVDI